MELREVLTGAERRAREALENGGTYRDADGVLRCAACGEAREAFIPGFGRSMPVTCGCMEAAERERKRRTRAEEARRRAETSPLYDAGYERFTFAADDRAQSANSQLCRSYVRRWEEMREGNFGLIFSGPLGTGKSFLAACIVNALCGKGVPAIIVTTARLVNVVRASREPQKAMDELNAFSLVALDDLGAERDTDFAVEVLESFVNSRALAARPLLVTTNLTGTELSAPRDLRYARLFDRVLALCPTPVLLTGQSRRAEQKESRRRQMKSLLEAGAPD